MYCHKLRSSLFSVASSYEATHGGENDAANTIDSDTDLVKKQKAPLT